MNLCVCVVRQNTSFYTIGLSWTTFSSWYQYQWNFTSFCTNCEFIVKKIFIYCILILHLIWSFRLFGRTAFSAIFGWIVSVAEHSVHPYCSLHLKLLLITFSNFSFDLVLLTFQNTIQLLTNPNGQEKVAYEVKVHCLFSVLHITHRGFKMDASMV